MAASQEPSKDNSGRGVRWVLTIVFLAMIGILCELVALDFFVKASTLRARAAQLGPRGRTEQIAQQQREATKRTTVGWTLMGIGVAAVFGSGVVFVATRKRPFRP